MAKPVKVAFNKNILVLPLSAILPLRAVSFATKQSAKYLRIAHSMAEVGIIEPLIVAPMRQGQQQHLLLDGHMRLAILSDLGSAETRCLIADDDEDDPAAVQTAPMQWLGAQDLAARDPVPLAVLELPCRFRDASIAALEAAGRSYRIALETPSLSALRAAVTSGLGVTCRTTLFIDQPIDAKAAGLPDRGDWPDVSAWRGLSHRARCASRRIWRSRRRTPTSRYCLR